MRTAAIIARAFLRRTEGVAASELALIMPILILLMLGGFELSRLVWLEVKLDRAVVSMGDLVARLQAANTTTMTNLFTAVGQIARPFPTGASSLVIVSSISLDPATNNPKLNWQSKGGGTLASTSRVAPCGGTIALPTGLTLQAGDVLIVSEIFYSFVPATGQGIVSPMTRYKNAYFRPRVGTLNTLQGATQTCS
jgi:Flp pilus assembly protein TadG